MLTPINHEKEKTIQMNLNCTKIIKNLMKSVAKRGDSV
jgi:hypothetical protein